MDKKDMSEIRTLNDLMMFIEKESVRRFGEIVRESKDDGAGGRI